MPYVIAISKHDIEIIERVLSDLGDEIAQVRSSVESNQAQVRRVMLGMEDNGGETS